MERDPLQDLEDKREMLELRLSTLRRSKIREGASIGLWTVVAGVGVAADILVLGGIGTGIAVLSGATFLGMRKESKKIEKQLKKVEVEIEKLNHKLREEAENPKPTPATPGLTEKFSPAAQREIDALRYRLEEIEKSIDKIEPEAKKNDGGKPKFNPPKP